MNELTRAQYLDALGIDTFVPRFVLPAAKPSVLCDLPAANEQGRQREAFTDEDASSNQGFEAHSIREQLETNESARAITNLLEDQAKPEDATEVINEKAEAVTQQLDAIVSETVSATVSTAVSHTGSTAKTSPASSSAKFSLGLWQSKDTLFVDSRRAGDALPTQALLLNIMQSVGLESSTLSKEEILNWPLVQKDSDQSWSAARAMVTSFLDGRLFSKPCSRFLILGKDAYQAVIGEESSFIEQLYAELTIETFEAKALVLPSLSDMLYKPELKRAVWIALHNFCVEK